MGHLCFQNSHPSSNAFRRLVGLVAAQRHVARDLQVMWSDDGGGRRALTEPASC